MSYIQLKGCVFTPKINRSIYSIDICVLDKNTFVCTRGYEALLLYACALYFSRHICLFLTFISHEMPPCRHRDTNQWVNIERNYQISSVDPIFCLLCPDTRLEKQMYRPYSHNTLTLQRKKTVQGK